MARIGGTEGRDELRGTGEGDVIFGNGGADTLHGQAGHDQLYGGSGDDVLRGGAGDDRLQGGPGDDTYIGGDGQDRFVFSHVPSGLSNEYIPVYQIGDILDFSEIDGNPNRAGDQPVRWLDQGDFEGRPGDLIMRHYGEGLSAYTKFYLDVDGDRSTDMTVTIDNGWYGFSTSNGSLVL